MPTPEELEAEQRNELNEMFEANEWTPPVEAGEAAPEVVPPIVPEVGDGVAAPNAEDLGVVEIPAAAQVVPKTPVEPSVEDMLRAQLQELTARLGQPVQQVYPAQIQAPVTPATTETPVAPVTQQIVTQEAFVPGTYLTDEELDRVIDNPRLIVEAIKRAQADVMKQMTSQLGGYQQTINQQVQQAVQQQIMVTKAITDFYDANQDLRKYAQFTQYVLAEVEGKYVGSAEPKTYADIFEETAKEARKRLGLPNPEVQTIERGRVVEQKPAFAGSKKGGNARPTETKELFDKNAADMMDI